MASAKALDEWQKRQEAYNARKQAMDYCMSPGTWERCTVEQMIVRASVIEKYLTGGIVPKATKKASKT